MSKTSHNPAIQIAVNILHNPNPPIQTTSIIRHNQNQIAINILHNPPINCSKWILQNQPIKWSKLPQKVGQNLVLQNPQVRLCESNQPHKEEQKPKTDRQTKQTNHCLWKYKQLTRITKMLNIYKPEKRRKHFWNSLNNLSKQASKQASNQPTNSLKVDTSA